MIKMINKNIVLFGLILLGCFLAGAQEKDTYNENVTINVAFNPMINDANMIRKNLSIFDTTFMQADFKFDRLKRAYRTLLQFDTIKAASVKGEPQDKLYNIELKGGLGFFFGDDLKTAFRPLLQASYSSIRDRSLLYGVQVSSVSALAGEKKYGHSGYSNEDINLFAKKIFHYYSLSSRLAYNFSRNYYYGSENYPLLDIDKSDYRISWHNLSGEVAYTKLERDETLQHDGRFNFNYTKNNRGGDEFFMHAMVDLSKSLDLLSGASAQRLGISVDYKHSFAKKNRALFDFAPYLAFDLNKFHVFASLGIEPGVNTRKDIQLLPSLTASFEIIQQVLSLYGGLKSESKMVSLNDIRMENPFIQPFPTLQDASYNTLFARGFLNIGAKVQISLEAGYQRMRNQYFYRNIDILNENVFNVHQVVYDDAEKYYLTMDNSFTLSNSFNFNLKMTLQRTNRDQEDFEAWYHPGFTLAAKFNYNYDNVLNISLVPTIYSKCKAYVVSLDKEVDVSSMFDINLNATYKYKDDISFFLDLHNFAFQQYYLFYDYPSYTFGIMAGAIFKF